MKPSSPFRRSGFARASALVEPRIRAASEQRGFAVSRVLTHWAEVVGADLAALCRPVGISYARGGMGATLTLLTTGAQAPMLDMSRLRILERVNAAYGHRAVSHIRITQTAAYGMAEGAAAFAHAPARDRPTPAAPDPCVQRAAEQVAEGVADTELRLALAALAANVLSRPKH